MPYLMQMMGCAATLLGLVLVVWLGFWMLVLIAVLSVFYALWLWLVRKGIVNPIPGMPPGSVVIEEETSATTIIDGEYRRVEEEKRE